MFTLHSSLTYVNCRIFNERCQLLGQRWRSHDHLHRSANCRLLCTPRKSKTLYTVRRHTLMTMSKMNHVAFVFKQFVFYSFYIHVILYSFVMEFNILSDKREEEFNKIESDFTSC